MNQYIIPIVINEKEKRIHYDRLIEALKPFSNPFRYTMKVRRPFPTAYEDIPVHQNMVIEISFDSPVELNRFLDSHDFYSIRQATLPSIFRRAYITREPSFEYTSWRFVTAG